MTHYITGAQDRLVDCISSVSLKKKKKLLACYLFQLGCMTLDIQYSQSEIFSNLSGYPQWSVCK